MPNLIAFSLVKWFKIANHMDPPEKLDASYPCFQAFSDHLTWIDQVPVTSYLYSIVTKFLSCTISNV